MKQKGLGEFEELVLLAVSILGTKAYGISVKEEIETHTGRTILLGAVHATLYRLQEKGFLTSEMGGTTAERGGRRKRLFTLTNTGMAQLQTAQAIRQRMWRLIPQLKLNM